MFRLNAKFFLDKQDFKSIIRHKKTRQGYTRKRILKLAGYFFLGAAFL
ncbi:hypothetical protein [Methyloglobulus sp.]